jgi:hypothetical protein
VNKAFHLLLLFCIAAVSPTGFGSEASVEELGRRCEAAREREIAPMRQAAIDECVSNRRSSRTREDCERINADFGEGGGTAVGGFRTRMFNDLPECVEYFKAQDERGSGRTSR